MLKVWYKFDLYEIHNWLTLKVKTVAQFEVNNPVMTKHFHLKYLSTTDIDPELNIWRDC